MRHAVTQWLGLAGFETLVHDKASSALNMLTADFPGVVVTDLKMEGIDGMELLRRSQQIDPEMPVVVITGHGDVETAVEAMRLGAYDFIEKPFAPERFLEVVRRAGEKRQLVVENRRLRRAVNEQTVSSRIIGTSRAAEAVARFGRRAAPAPMSASCSMARPASARIWWRAACTISAAATKPTMWRSIARPCRTTMVESEFFGHEAGAFTSAVRRRASARSSTPAAARCFSTRSTACRSSTQAKLLRALQDRVIERLGSNRNIPVDLRPIAASKVDLRAASSDGRFRSDLYYRLSVVELTIPPLRERIEDVPLLFEYFAASAAAAHGRELRPVTSATLNMLMTHSWPGNVRELRNAAERYALGLSGPLMPQASDTGSERLSLAQQVEAFERALIERCLTETGGRISAVIERLEIPRRTLSEKMVRLGIDRQRFRNIGWADCRRGFRGDWRKVAESIIGATCSISKSLK